MDLSKHFKLEDFVSNKRTTTLRRICVNILEPIKQRFGQINIDNSSDLYSIFDVRFTVTGYSNDIIADYIKTSLVHSDVTCSNNWIYVSCDPEA
jgi:hypothetical protein